MHPNLLPADAGEAVWFTGTRMTIKAGAESTGGAFGLVEGVARPGFSPPLHIHHREDEAFWLLEGRLTVRCGDHTYSALPGSFAFLPRGVPHTFRVDGDTPARLLSLSAPGGFERFFAEVGSPAQDNGLPPQAPPDVARLKQIGERFGLEIVGPPLS